MNDTIECKQLLEIEDLEIFRQKLMSISSEEILCLYVYNFNYDGNIEKLNYVIENLHCTRNVALKMFYLLDGYSFLLGEEQIFSDEQVIQLLNEIYKRLVNNSFKIGDIRVKSEFTKVQIYKLQKVNPQLSEDILFGIEGKSIDYNL